MNATVVRFSDLDKWNIPKTLRLISVLPSGWRWAKIETLVSQVPDKVKVEKDVEYKMIGVKWYAEGTFHRETVKGSAVSAKYLTPVKPGAFIYNRLFAWKYSFAVVPKEHDGFFVSNEFPQFIVDETKILAQYLYLIFRLEKTIKAVLSASVGSAAVSRNRFKEEEFLKFEIPLPPLDFQQAVVTLWRKAQQLIESSKQASIKVVESLNKRLYSLYQANTKTDILKSRYLALTWSDIQQWDVKSSRASAFRNANASFCPLGDFVEEVTDLVKTWEEPEKEWAIYGVNNKEGVFFNQYRRGKEFRNGYAYKRIRRDWFFHNPTRSSVGSLGIVPEVPDNAITSPEYQVWRIKSGLIPGFVATLISTPFFIELIQFHRVGAVKQRLYVDNLLEIRIPVLPEEEQHSIAETREKALKEIEEAKKNMQQVSKEVEALILGMERL